MVMSNVTAAAGANTFIASSDIPIRIDGGVHRLVPRPGSFTEGNYTGTITVGQRSATFISRTEVNE